MSGKLQPSRHETHAQVLQRLRVFALKDDCAPMWPAEHGLPPRDALPAAPELYLPLTIICLLPRGYTTYFVPYVEPKKLEWGDATLVRDGNSDSWFVFGKATA